MKKINLRLTIVGLCLFLVTQTMAGELTIPNTFVADTPAVADDVNANFNAVETAVDDNNTRISDVESAVGDNDARVINIETLLQNITTGCRTGWTLRRINADGSLTCDLDDDTTYTAGKGIEIQGTEIRTSGNTVRIPAHAFRYVRDSSFTLEETNCALYGSFDSYHLVRVVTRQNAAQPCNRFDVRIASTLTLPHGVTITGFDCDIEDNYPGNAEASLRKDYFNDIASTGQSVDDSNGPVTYAGTLNAEPPVVDNGLYNYFVQVRFVLNVSPAKPNETQNTPILYGCHVYYE